MRAIDCSSPLEPTSDFNKSKKTFSMVMGLTLAHRIENPYVASHTFNGVCGLNITFDYFRIVHGMFFLIQVLVHFQYFVNVPSASSKIFRGICTIFIHLVFSAVSSVVLPTVYRGTNNSFHFFTLKLRGFFFVSSCNHRYLLVFRSHKCRYFFRKSMRFLGCRMASGVDLWKRFWPPCTSRIAKSLVQLFFDFHF